MKANKSTVFLLFLVMQCLATFSQSEELPYYYYKGNQLYFEFDTKKISICVESENRLDVLKSMVTDQTWNTLSVISENQVRKSLITPDSKAEGRKGIKTYYFELTSSNAIDNKTYFQKIEELNQLPNLLKVSPALKNQDNNSFGLFNTFCIELKSSEDLPKLYAFAKKYNIEVLGSNSFMPLWYTLSCGKTTPFNALRASNLAYESGQFNNSEPELAMTNLLSNPLFPNQWTLNNTGQSGGVADIDMNVQMAWNVTSGIPGVVSSVIDEGFELNHPDLANNNTTTGYDATSNSGGSVVNGPHGTNCAGLIAAVNNNIGVIGVAPNSRICSISVNFNVATNQTFANGFNHSVSQGFEVISNSWSGGAPSSILDQAIANAISNNIVVVFSSGNGNSPTGEYPGNSNPAILTVGAVDRCGIRSGRIDVVPASCDPWCTNCKPGSSFGSALDVVAGGTSIFTTDQQGSAGNDPGDFDPGFGGTSAACPIVAGVVALVRSANPNLSVAQTVDIVEQSCRKIRNDIRSYGTTNGRPNGTWHNEVGYGMPDAYQAVLLAKASVCTANEVITADVFAPYTNDQQASQSILATNIINNGAQARYHATDVVELKNGFSAVLGSDFHAYNLGCTNTYFRFSSNGTTGTNGNYEPSNEILSDNSSLNQLMASKSKNSNKGITIIPNPSAGEFLLRFNMDNFNPLSIRVLDAMGKLVYEETSPNPYMAQLDLRQLSDGVYLIKVEYSDKVITERIIKSQN